MARSNRVKRAVHVVDGDRVSRKSDHLAVEEPLEIQLRAGNAQKTIAITMRTPGNDYELAAGFLYNEGVVEKKHDIVQMTYCVDGTDGSQEYNLLAVTLQGTTLPELPALDRHFFTSSACGVCGRTMLDELENRTLPPLPTGPAVGATTLTSLPAKLRVAQHLFDSTGGLHAAALFSQAGELLALREDVGRHNALDKLIGAAVLNGGLPFNDKIILLSGRASYELLQKCRVAGAPILCAVSAPSSLAVELAAHFGITLVGFLRGERFNIYAGRERVNVGALASTELV